MCRSKFSISLYAALFFLLWSGLAFSATYSVDDDPGADFTSIQAAINAASAGDTILVREGTYYENISLKTGVDVLGEGFDKTMIKGRHLSHTVYANGVTDAVFDGFAVVDCKQDDNYAGITIKGGNLVVSHNLVTNNIHGIYLIGGSSAVIKGNIITLNGISDYPYLNYGIICLHSTPLITNNIISKTQGVGIYIAWEDSSGARLINNTVVNNKDNGIWCYKSSPVIKNNISAYNMTGISASYSAKPVITYNDIYDNIWRDYDSQTEGVAAPGRGDISIDPQLVPPSSNFERGFYLGEESPCIDAGDPNPLYNDIDGTRNDMGAYGGPDGARRYEGSGLNTGFLFTSVGNIPVSEITQSGAQRGLANVSHEASNDLHIPEYKDSPFGNRLWISGMFGTNDTEVRYYRIMVASWNQFGLFFYKPIEDTLKKVLYTINTDGTVTATRELIGPLPNWKNLRGLYKRTDTGYWANRDLKVVWDTRSLDNGTYILTFEAYDAYLNRINFQYNTILYLRVDNSPVEAEIHAVMDGSGQQAEECSMIGLASTTDNLSFVITARHPNGFLRDYTLSVLYGRNRSAGFVVRDRYEGSHDDTPPIWSGVSNQTFESLPAMQAGDLMPWQDPGCAYQFHLSAWARTTDGFHYIKHTVFDDHYYLLLSRPNYCYGDIDDNGVVDGNDLSLFINDYGRSDCH